MSVLTQMPSPCETVESWELAVMCGSCSCPPQGAGLLLPLLWKMWCILCWVPVLHCVLFPHIPACSVSDSVADSFYWTVGKWPGLVVKGFTWSIQPGNFYHDHTHQTSEVVLESGKHKTPGDTKCPHLSLESAGLRSLISRGGSQAQSRYILIERCPAEKD